MEGGSLPSFLSWRLHESPTDSIPGPLPLPMKWRGAMLRLTVRTTHGFGGRSGLPTEGCGNLAHQRSAGVEAPSCTHSQGQPFNCQCSKGPKAPCHNEQQRAPSYHPFSERTQAHHSSRHRSMEVLRMYTELVGVMLSSVRPLEEVTSYHAPISASARPSSAPGQQQQQRLCGVAPCCRLQLRRAQVLHCRRAIVACSLPG